MGWGKIRDMAIAATQMVIRQVFKDNGKNPETDLNKILPYKKLYKHNLSISFL